MEYVKTQMAMDLLWIEGFEALITHTMWYCFLQVMPSHFFTVPIAERKAFIFYPAYYC